MLGRQSDMRPYATRQLTTAQYCKTAGYLSGDRCAKPRDTNTTIIALSIQAGHNADYGATNNNE